MHPFPPADDLQFLVGEAIAQVELDPWSLQFRFDSGGQITAEGRIEHIDKRGAVHPHDCQERADNPLYLHQLLQQSIVQVSREPYRLSLTLSGGDVLTILSDDGPYECGQIYAAALAEKGPIVF